MLNKYGKYNYNEVVKLLIGIFICQFIILILFTIANLMFYRVNFNNSNNSNNTQIVNIDNSPKYEKIDLNTCSYEALDNLEGIGEVKANKIINGRPYEDIYQIKKIVGDKTFDKIKNNIKVGDDNEQGE